MASPLQPLACKLPPAPRAGFATGGEAEGGRAAARYVHTSIGTSSPQAWIGRSQEGEEFARRRTRAALRYQIVTNLGVCGRDSEAKAISTCGRSFRKRRLPCGACQVIPLRCDHPLCVECERERAKPLRKKILARCKDSKLAFQFLTLTVPNVPKLTNEVVRKLIKDFARLRRTEVFTCKRRSQDFGLAVSGGVLATECTYNLQTRTWHPHIHALIEGPRKFTRVRLMALREQWMRITGGGKYLKLQPLYRLSSRGKKVVGKPDRKALRELLKYITKAAAFASDPALLDEFLTSFKNVRRVQAWGSFLGAMKESEREPGDETGSFDCRHCGGTHLHRDCRHEGVAAFDEVEQLPDGTWRLKFDFVRELKESVPDESPPEWFTSYEPTHVGQREIGFSGVMPEKSEQQPSLFEDAA